MNEILFRGMSIEDDEFVYGDLVQKIGKKFIRAGNGAHLDEVYPETIGQYTCVKDKNRHMVFDGDIISFNDGKSIGKVIWTVGQYYVDCEDFEEEYDGTDASCSLIELWANNRNEYEIDAEIIGNIYED